MDDPRFIVSNQRKNPLVYKGLKMHYEHTFVFVQANLDFMLYISDTDDNNASSREDVTIIYLRLFSYLFVCSCIKDFFLQSFVNKFLLIINAEIDLLKILA